MDAFFFSEWRVKVQRLKRGKITIPFILGCDRSKSLKSRPFVHVEEFETSSPTQPHSCLGKVFYNWQTWFNLSEQTEGIDIIT